MKLSELDQVLIRYADSLSPAQISFKIEGALSPEQVASRIATLLQTSDWLDAAQQDQLVTLKMRQLIVELEEQPRTARNAEVLIRSLEALGSRLDKRREGTEQDLQRLYAFQGQVMLDAVLSAVEALSKRLEPSFPQVPTIIQDALPDALRSAQLELEKHDPA